MTRTLARNSFHSSKFVRILTDLAGGESTHSGDAFAEKLGEWMHITDAIALRSTHTRPSENTAVPASMHASCRDVKVVEDFEQERAALEHALNSQGSSTTKARPNRSSMPTPTKGESLELASVFEPYRRYYLAQQREMDLKVKLLRDKIREALINASPALQQLVALDAAMEKILSAQEAKLLAKVTMLLETRFKQLRQAHQDTLANEQQEDSVDLWMKPGGWLTRFRQEMQSLLLAELDLRLQPTLGLVEALQNDKAKNR
jgi:hypothetical protein